MSTKPHDEAAHVSGIANGNSQRLVDGSFRILRSGQVENGAFIACPAFPVYRYCWFRDGAFIAQALDLWGDSESAERFYNWGSAVILDNADVIDQATKGPLGAVPDVYLHTRYEVDGSTGKDDWPNFQLDGFGTFLWALADHVERNAIAEVPDQWTRAARLLARYLSHLWRSPNFDCWEEFPQYIHTSTLCALYGGLLAAARCFGEPESEQVATDIRAYIRTEMARNGWLRKSSGIDAPEASTLWAAVPFGVFEPTDEVMVQNVAAIRAHLESPRGGIHRYADDSYFGGGLWILLTAALGEVLLAQGDRPGARDVLRWIESQASPEGFLPEQVSDDLNAPDMYEPWVERWGPAATPLLWSHAAYLRFYRAWCRQEARPPQMAPRYDSSKSGR